VRQSVRCRGGRVAAVAAWVLVLGVACAGPVHTPVPIPTPAATAVPTQTLLPTPTATTVASAAMPWWNDAVFYEVFVRSFYDSDADGIGDLQGLIQWLDYLNDGDPATFDDLGVTGLWLMPVAESPSYHGYDVVDYRQIEQDYGTNADFEHLVEEAHRRGIKIIVDLVMNHTSKEHPWFVDAVTTGSDHDAWYVWESEMPTYRGPWGQAVWHKAGDRFYYGVFWEGMPDLDYRNKVVTEAMYDVARFWLEDMAVDGFRLDAVKHLIEDGQVQENTTLTHAWMRGFHDFVRSVAPEPLIIGEVWSETSKVAKYIGDELDLAFEFSVAEAIIDSIGQGSRGPLERAQEQVLRSYPEGQYAVFLTNHDQERVMTQLASEPESGKLAATLLLTSPGVPFVYYGEEIGMQGRKPDRRIRTPMQWDDTPGTAGFTTGVPWEELAVGYAEYNVAVQAADDDSLLNHYRKLIRLRERHRALRTGSTWLVDSSARQVYSFLRHDGGDTLLVLVNLGRRPVSDYQLSLPTGPLTGVLKAVSLLGDGEVSAPDVNAAGGFDVYVPLSTLSPRNSTVIRLDQ